eukprot:7821284-Pyramimonas_sp.AAC.1
MDHFANAAILEERHKECLRDGIEELYDTPTEDWVGARWHRHAQDSSGYDDDESCPTRRPCLPLALK